jgi:hypothetical protein
MRRELLGAISGADKGGGRARLRRAIVLGYVLVPLAAACKDKAPSSDPDLARDLALVSHAPVQPPALHDTAVLTPSTSKAPKASATKTPVRTVQRERTPAKKQTPTPPPPPKTVAVAPPEEAPDPSPAPAKHSGRVIASGTSVALTSASKICTESNRPGDKIVASVDSPIMGSDGAVIPAGSKVVLELASVTPGSSPEESRVVFHVRALYVGENTYPVEGDVVQTTSLQRVRVDGDGSSDRRKMVGGAIAGAILGQILGRNTKSTVIGAGAGAAAGAVAAKAGERFEGCLPESSPLRLTLAQPVSM